VKLFQKYKYHIFCTLILVLIVLLGFLFTSTEKSVSLYFDGELNSEKIAIYLTEDGYSCVFLPSFVAMEDLKFNIPPRREVLLNGQVLSSGDSCERILPGREYELCIDGRNTTIVFYRSSNIASLFIDTASGSIDHIHKDKDREEQAGIRLYSFDGAVEHQSDDSFIKGRGNTTWEWYAKKPYLLKLSEASELLGMSMSEKWVLLANAADSTNLRNKIVLDAANTIVPGFAPESRYVDLYLNGEYRGLYLLTQKIDSSSLPLLNIDEGDFLCTHEITSRAAGLPNVFKSAKGRSVEVVDSRALTEEEFARIQTLVNEMEAVILSGDSAALSQVLDLDSWVRRYLIDEVFANIDSDAASSYFYYSDGIFHAGPVWDYDLSFGYYLNSEAFSYPGMLVAQPLPTRRQVSYNYALYNNEAFYQRMVEIYRDEFLPLLMDLIENKIEAQYSVIDASAKMNSLRWNPIYTQSAEGSIFPAPELLDYLSARMEFLNSAWLEGKTYHHVRFFSSTGSSLFFTAVESGAYVDPTCVDSYGDAWIDTATGEVFDFSQPVLSDLSLRAQSETPEETASAQSSTRQIAAVSSSGIVIALSLVLMLCLLLLFLARDFRHTHERKRQNESTRTKISS